jgi:hypothetical protein
MKYYINMDKDLIELHNPDAEMFVYSDVSRWEEGGANRFCLIRQAETRLSIG